MERNTTFFTHQGAGDVNTASRSDMWVMLVGCRPYQEIPGNRALALDCLVPQWSDVADHLEGEDQVMLIVHSPSGGGLRWLKIQGRAHPVESSDWAKILPHWPSTLEPDWVYLAARMPPHRIDMVDEDQGWGVQGTLEW